MATRLCFGISTRSRGSVVLRALETASTATLQRLLRAKVLLIENVEGILTKRVEDGGAFVLDRLRADLDAAGFMNRREYLLDSWDHGVPQRRRRYFCLASRLPQLRLRPPRPNPVRPTVAEAFADLPEEAGVAEYGPGRSGDSLLMRSRVSWPWCPRAWSC